MRHMPDEHRVRDAMHRLEQHGTHRFAVPVVTPHATPPPKQSGDW
jgi:hypothetical protein